MKDFKYTTIFSSEVKPLVSEEKDAYLALAAINNIGDLVPDVDTDRNVDLLPVAFNAFVANRINKNHDVINTEAAMSIANHFINKPINIEHNRGKVIGTILTAGYSEFGTDKPLTEEEVKQMNGPFNVTLGGVIWKTVNEEVADLIEDSSDPTSNNYLRVSASWELGFSDYQLVVINSEDKNIENAEFITEKTQIDELKANLKSFGGDGLTEDGKFLYRQVIGNIVPLGIGLTETPAAEVKGIVTKKAEASLEKEVEIPVESETESISQEKEINVKNKHKSKDIIMNINSINDITDENLKEVSASAISDFIQKELESASEQFSAEKQEVETALKDAEEKHETLSKDHEELKTNLEAVKAELEELQAEKLEKERQEAFNNRMALMDEEYELTDEDREVIASDIKDMDEETFAAYGEKMKVLLKSKNKKQLEEKKKEEAAKASEIEASQEQISETEASATEDVVEEVLEETEVKAEVPVSTAAEEPSVYDKYKAAFDMDGFEF
jgi:hypothetical protein|tara:strand:- start:872 stop:2374 length:1503 start_codon:yes stop_codon:yes gene_type:complete